MTYENIVLAPVRNEIIVVDTAVGGYEDLLIDLDPSLEVIFIDGSAGGMAQIAEALDGRYGIDGLHILSHGSAGEIALGTDVLSADTLESHAQALSVLASALSEQADVLLYGCHIGADQKGREFITALAQITGADVLASDDLTGSADLAGDWDLEIQAGAIETDVPFSSRALADFGSVLGLPGTADFNSAPASGAYGGAANIDGTYTNGGFTLVFDGADVETEVNYAGSGKVIFGVNESSVTISLQGGESFDIEGIYLNNFNGATDTFNFTTNKGAAGSVDIDHDSSTTYTFGSATPANITGITSFTMTAGDGTFGGYIDNLVITNVQGANTAPALGGTPADDTATEDVAAAIDLSAYTVSDADGDTITLTLAVDRGTIASIDGDGTFGNVTIASSGTASMTLQGTAADLNSYLDDTSHITFTTAANDTAAATLTVTPNDGTENGTADTVSITINAVNDDPAVSGLPTDITFQEDTAGSVDLSAASFTDVDSASITVTITASEGTFSAPADGSGVGGGVTETLVNSTTITLAGAAGDINTYLDTASNIQWTGAENDTGGDTSTFTVTIDDGDGSGSVAAGTVNADVTAVNDAPVFAGLDAAPAFTEGGSAFVLDANVTVSDVELDALNGGNGDYSGAQVTILRNGGASGDDAFSVASGGNLTVSGGPDGGGTITAGGNVIAVIANAGDDDELTIDFANNGTTPTTALVNEILQAITYGNTGDNPGASVQLDWTFDDASDDVSGSVTVSLTGVNDAPTLSATGSNPTHAEGDAGSDLYSTVAASTVESGQTLTGLTLTVTNVTDGADEILSFDGSDIALTNGNSVTTATNNLSVSVSVSGTTATVSFSGESLTEAQLQTLVDGITYRNTSDDPDTAANRVVTVTALSDDGGGTDTATLSLASTVTLTAVNDAPVIANLNGDSSGLQPGGTASIDSSSDASLSNVDSADNNGGFLTIVQTSGSVSDGSFSVDGTAVTSGGDSVLGAGEMVQVGGVTIGTVDVTDDGQGGNDLTINFNTTDATDARVQTLIQNLAWGAAAGSGAQNFTLTLNDGDGTTGGGDEDTTAAFTMTLGNAPVLDLDADDSSGNGSGGFAASFTEGGVDVAIADSDVSVTDADAGATIAAITISLTNDQNGADEGLTVSAAAQNALTGISGASAITRQDTISITGATASLAEVQTFLQNVFYSNTSQAPGNTSRSVTVTLTDDDGLTSSQVTAAVSVSTVNDNPTFSGLPSDINFSEDTTGNVDLSALAFDDVDSASITVTITASEGTFSAPADGSGVGGGVTETLVNSTTITLAGAAGDINTYLDTASNIQWAGAENDTGGDTSTFTVTVNDGDGSNEVAVGTVNADIAALNDAPETGTLNGDSPSGAPDAVIVFDASGDATVTDVDSADFNGGTLTITRTGALSGNFSLDDTAATSGADGVITAGETIAVGGTDIGTVTTDGQGTGNLVITFNSADATPANVQALIRALTYQSSETGSHGFTVSLADGDGGTSTGATVTVAVTTPSSGGGGGGGSGGGGGGGGGTADPETVTVVTDEDTTGGSTTTTTTVSTNSDGSGSAAIVENTNNNGNVVTATLPSSTTISSSGPSTAQTPGEAVTSLVNAVDARDSSAESALIGGAQTFLTTLAQNTTLDVRTIVPTTTQTSLSEPIVITGTSAADGSTQSEAFVIDLRSLPSGTTLQLDNIEFATIVGEATVTGGSGQNYVVGDDNRQFIVLGADDDQLFGGAGDDTVGSEGGDDLIYGEAGNDLLFGGAGDDTLNGGANLDAALYSGTNTSVTLSGPRSSATAAGSQGTDTLTGVELVVFTGDNTSGKDRVTVLAQDGSLAAGQYGFNEAAYLAANPDVAAAVAAGAVASGAEHYALYGQSEGRSADLIFDEAFYLADNADVAAAVAAGGFTSASEHYLLNGYAENRSVNPLFDADYYLAQNADIAAAIEAGAFTNGYHHFVLYGDSEGRAASAFFDTATYRSEQGLARDVSALEHFILIGLPQGITAPTAADFTAQGAA